MPCAAGASVLVRLTRRLLALIFQVELAALLLLLFLLLEAQVQAEVLAVLNGLGGSSRLALAATLGSTLRSRVMRGNIQSRL